MKENKIYNTALYCRISLDNGSVGESGSIQTQKIILEEFAKMHEFKIYDFMMATNFRFIANLCKLLSKN